MAKRVKAGTVAVELELDKDQFNKDWKSAHREVVSMQKQLSLELERNKVKFAVEGMDKKWDPFDHTVIGKIREAGRETQLLNTQISFQKNKVDIARAEWEAMTATKGAAVAATVAAERSFMREQMALIGLQKQLEGTASAGSVMGGAVMGAAKTAAAAVVALAAAYAAAAKEATAWGQSVNDLVDETGMADQEAARFMGTMNIVGLSSEEAAGSIAKMARTVNAAAAAQATAKRTNQESTDVFTKYGIAITDTNGGLLDYAQILANIQAVHGGMQDSLQKTSMEMDIFGKSGYKMNDFLNLSKEQMDEYAKRIDKMGLSIKDSAKYEALNFQLNEMSLALKGIAITITGDDIPAITKFIAKMTEFSGWLKDNKDGVDDFKASLMTLGGWAAKPFTIGMELTAAGLKKYVEAVDKAAKADKAPSSETDFVERQAQAAKNAADLAKKQSDANRAKAAAEKDLIYAQRDLSDAILTMQGKTLEVTLRNIEREREAWIKKTNDEVAVTRWAEAAKTKAMQDAIDARLGPEVAAAKKAILEGTNIGDAIYKASEQRKNEERATFEARQLVKKYYGITEPGDEMKTLQVDYLKNSITQLSEIAKSLTIPKDRNGRTPFDPYQPTPAAPMFTDANGARTNGIPQGQPGSIVITVSPTVNANGMDAASAKQLGEVVAAQIIPQVQAAIASAKTSYGGPQ